MGFPAENSLVMRLEEEHLEVDVIREKHFLFQGGWNKQGEWSHKEKNEVKRQQRASKAKTSQKAHLHKAGGQLSSAWRWGTVLGTQRPRLKILHGAALVKKAEGCDIWTWLRGPTEGLTHHEAPWIQGGGSPSFTQHTPLTKSPSALRVPGSHAQRENTATKAHTCFRGREFTCQHVGQVYLGSHFQREKHNKASELLCLPTHTVIERRLPVGTLIAFLRDNSRDEEPASDSSQFFLLRRWRRNKRWNEILLHWVRDAPWNNWVRRQWLHLNSDVPGQVERNLSALVTYTSRRQGSHVIHGSWKRLWILSET